MTTTEYAPTAEEAERDREAHIACLRGTLETLDVQSTQITLALHHMRELRRAANALVDLNTARLSVRAVDMEEWWEPKSTGLDLPESVQTLLAGSFKEPVRELIAATDAAEARLVRAGVDGEEQIARIERELVELRG